MNIKALLEDPAMKTKEKTVALSEALLHETIHVNQLILVATALKDSDKATCIEALEYASKQNPKVMSKKSFEFVVLQLKEKAPRLKLESARVIGNTAHLFKDKLEEAIINLLENTENPGTVVRWSAAFALGEILKLKTMHHEDLLPAIESLLVKEEKNSIKKIYQEAIKKVSSSKSLK